MASQKVTDLSADTSVKNTDTYLVVDTTDFSQDPAGSSYKITWATIKAAILALFSAGTGITFSGGVISSDPTATQTLTNKTITAPTITSPTFTGTVTNNGSYSGTAILPVANGGTGTSSLTAHGLVIGNGTSTPNVSSTGTIGQILTSNGPSADPTFQAPASANPSTTSTIFPVGAAVTAGQAVYIGPYQSDGGVLIDTSGTSTTNSTGITIGNNSNRGLVVFAYPTTAAATINSATFNGVSLTAIDTFQLGNLPAGKSYYLSAPPTGTSSLVFSASTGTVSCTYYSVYNVAQTSQPEAHTSGFASSGPFTVSLSTIADGAIIFVGASANFTAGTALYEHALTVGAIAAGDSGQVFPAGTSVSITDLTSGTFGNTYGAALLSLAPATTVTEGAVSPASAAASTNQYFNKYSSFAGFAQVNASSGTTVAVTTGGIATGLSGLSVLSTDYYLSNTPGTIATSPGSNTRKVGISTSATSLIVTNIW